ncbi:alpha/beta fold hydrolase [Shewanella gaetbuli]
MQENESKPMMKTNQIGEEFTIPLAHLNIAACRYGHENLPIILACHGWLDNLNSFKPLAEAFLASDLVDQYQLITFDWPGHGLSEHRPGLYPLNWVDYVYDLDNLIETLLVGVNRPDLVLLGHSLGGIVASAYNACAPQRVNKLILIEAIAPLFEDASLIKQRLNKSLKQHRVHANTHNSNKQPIPTSLKPSGYNSIEIVAKARHKLTGLDEKWCHLIARRNLVNVDEKYCWRSDSRLKLDSMYRMTFEQVDALMSHNETQTLLVLGENGYKQLKSAKKQVLDWFTEVQLIELPGCHHLHMSHATSLLAQIRAFILK